MMESNTSETIANTVCTNATSAITFGPLNVREWLLIASFSMIFLCGVIGNGLVIFIFGYKKKPKKSSSTERLIFYLAIIDFFASLFNPLLFMYLIVTRHKQWHFGHVGCKVIPAFGPITTTASAGMLLLFAVDRYRAIIYPFRGELSFQTITFSTIFIITISILSNIHYIYSIELTNKYGCRVPKANSLHYGLPNCALIVLRLSLFIFVFIYTHICISLVLRRRNRCPSFNHELATKRECESKKVTRCILIMSIVFLLLVFPREIFYLIYNFSWLVFTCGIRFTEEVVLINSFLKVLHTANSCANVFIYSHMHLYYRKHVLKFLWSIGPFCVVFVDSDIRLSSQKPYKSVSAKRRCSNSSGLGKLTLNQQETNERLVAENEQIPKVIFCRVVDGKLITSRHKKKTVTFFKRMQQYNNFRNEGVEDNM